MSITLQKITHNDRAELEQVRQYFYAYKDNVGVDLSFQNFDEEITNLPSAYTEPEGRLFLAKVNDKAVGCIGLRKFSDTDCELKRLYVDPASRGLGVGNALTLAAIQAAQQIGYQRMILDTLPTMRMALQLYQRLGFEKIPAYYPTPIEGTVFLALDLNKTINSPEQDEQLKYLFDSNRAWADKMHKHDADFFNRLSKQQNPQYLWIGCSDSRVPANQIVGLLPGEVFVHRNIANVVVHTDLNCLSVLQFAVDVLKVKHIMVVGHYGCGGVLAALSKQRVGLADLWLNHVQAVHQRHRSHIDQLADDNQHDRLCELNVLEQAANVCQTQTVQDAWARGQPLSVHGWIYAIHDGLLRDLGLTVSYPEQLSLKYKTALAKLSNQETQAAQT